MVTYQPQETEEIKPQDMPRIIDALAENIVKQTQSLSQTADVMEQTIKKMEVPKYMKQDCQPVFDDVRKYAQDMRTYSSKTMGSLTSQKYVGRDNLPRWMALVRQSLETVHQEYAKFQERTQEISGKLSDL